MKNKLLNKRNIIILSVVVILLIIIFVLKNMNNSDVKLYLDFEMDNINEINNMPNNLSEIEIDKGSTITLLPSIDNKIEYVVDNEQILKIDGNKVTGIKSGNVTIYAKYKNVKSNSIIINVISEDKDDSNDDTTD